MTATPREVVHRYSFELYGQRRFELVDELLAETMTRHEVGGAVTLNRADARRRVETQHARVTAFETTLLNVVAEGEYVCTVYRCDLTYMDGRRELQSGIQVFRVVDGLITDVWNSEERGAWSVADPAFVGAPPDWGILPGWPRS